MKELEKLFDLPQDDDDDVKVELEDSITEESKEIITIEAMNTLARIDAALPSVKGLELSDKEMDDLHNLAVDSYKDLMTLGMNVEARIAIDILNSASQFLGHAITAKQAKITKKIKMIELQLKKAKLDQDSGNDNTTEGEGKLLDRNELLAEVLKQTREYEDKKD